MVPIHLVAAEPPVPKGMVAAPQTLINFDHDAVGKIPLHFTLAVTGKGPDVHWEVRQDAHAPSLPNLLIQSGAAEPGDNFALLLADGFRMEQGEIAVRFRPMAGEVNQAMGIVFRYRDPQNYYVIEGDSRGDQCRLISIKNGKKKIIDSQEVVITTLTWHELRIVFSKNKFTAAVDGELILGTKDSSLQGPGQVGLWTVSDSSIAFDDLRITSL